MDKITITARMSWELRARRAEACVAELQSGLHEIAASLPVHESKDIDAGNVDDVCRAVKLALRRYADDVERVDTRVEVLEAQLEAKSARIVELKNEHEDDQYQLGVEEAESEGALRLKIRDLRTRVKELETGSDLEDPLPWKR